MFNEKTCQRCGVCLEQCPFMQLPLEKAKKEIIKMIETKSSRRILKKCASCSYCNVVCPTGSNPFALIREIQMRNTRKEGVISLALITEEIPNNLMTIGLEIDPEKKQQDLKKYLNPPKSEEMFYLGCGIPYVFSDLAKTKLLEDLPAVGGIKYCCGSYVRRFGEEESRIKGLDLFEKFKTLGVKKLITFCPGCETMLKGVYPSIIEGYDIVGQNIIEFFIEKYHKGELEFKNKIKKRITFQDPCPWRNLDRKIYQSPRAFLEIIGAEVVEMEHNKEKSLCCGAPFTLTNRNAALGNEVAKKRVSEAENVNADIIAHICTGCLHTLSQHASDKNIESYYVTELAQMAIGEKAAHTIVEASEQIKKAIFNKIRENPCLLTERYIIKNGEIKQV